jgi:hypothetical protein
LLVLDDEQDALSLLARDARAFLPRSHQNFS